MASKQVKTCDIFGGIHAKSYVIEVREAGKLDVVPPELRIESDLGKRGLKRLKRFLERATTKPNQKPERPAGIDGT